MSDAPKWLIDLAWRVEHVVRTKPAMTRFREMVRRWQLQQNKRLAIRATWRKRRQAHFNSAVPADPRLRDKAAGPPDEGGEFTRYPQDRLSGWTPPELLMHFEPRTDLPIPLCRPLSLVEKYAVMSAVHDFICPSRDPIGPCHDAALEPPWEEAAFQSMLEGMSYAVLIHHYVPKLDEESRRDLEAILSDLRSDIHSSRDASSSTANKAMITPKVPVERQRADIPSSRDASSSTANKAMIIPKVPGKKAWQAWRIKTMMGITNQTEIAQKMVEQGVKCSQGEVSRLLSQVDEHFAAGGVAPPMPDPMRPSVATDPAIIDKGERTDHHSRHQRLKQD